MDPTLTTALVVAIPTVLSTVFMPIFLAWMAYSQKRQDKIEEYARQDLVAARAEAAAKELLESNKKIAAQTDQVATQAAEAAKLLLAANERVSQDTKLTNVKLDTIHGLVNSNMTAAMQAELDATMRERAVMQELMELKKGMGKEPTVDTLAALKSATDRTHELNTILADRLASRPVS